ncbi:hypothetical protein IEQ34_005317 [Dendrobium chrysotoxum]|uniref:Isopenicillin N synthase-like Fe(2+) 2OG dioxygenase domain-containing protein n=1 Tax=Dendrobium chrysotoxum TaxID=161865 RepID=A0AAV7HBY1_DENCH|nr:hypothetical protein IEQ34_005317 [Dendrobium chrysotoxum]
MQKTWAKARADIDDALKHFRGFEVVYDEVGSELRGGLFRQAIPELFAVPDIEKLISASEVPYHELGTKVVLPSHKDPNYISIISQPNIGGLEMETSNGEWISTNPIKNSFTVLIGEAFMITSLPFFFGYLRHGPMKDFKLHVIE